MVWNAKHWALQRAQIVEQVLLLRLAECIEVVNHIVGLRWAEAPIAGALVSLNRLYEVGRAPVVEEEDPLTEPPEWGGAEFIAIGFALADVVGEAWPHLV